MSWSIQFGNEGPSHGYGLLLLDIVTRYQLSSFITRCSTIINYYQQVFAKNAITTNHNLNYFFSTIYK